MLTAIRNGYLSTMLFIESGIIFLIGGVIAISSSIFFSKIKEHFFHSEERWSTEKQKKSEQKANLYILAGAIMFLESLILALMIF
jgi:NADH:ubiquinone oxidoreductase subunit 5 (subunit L)/multisubunit Na+/H+ antiporter MnhA subunit